MAWLALAVREVLVMLLQLWRWMDQWAAAS